MTKPNTKPVVLLIYANTGVALENLEPETDAIESHLKASGLCDVKIVPAATVERQLEIPPATIRITGSRLDLEVAHSGDNRGIASNCGMEFRDN